MREPAQICLATGCEIAASVGPFCAEHSRAPSGRRGGWISAAKRRPTHGVRAIDRRLWIGPTLSPNHEIAQIDMIVLCAAEIQPDLPLFLGKIVRCPLLKGTLEGDQVRAALAASVVVANEIKAGSRVLVTCDDTLRRCSFVVALSMCHLTAMGHEKIIDVLSRGMGTRPMHPSHVEIVRRVAAGRNPRTGRGGRLR
jgi:hypothetical protein